VPGKTITQHLGDHRAQPTVSASPGDARPLPRSARSAVSNSCDYGLLVDRRTWRENRKFLS
jgi:hypothetical protein